MRLEYSDGATPIEPDDVQDLIPDIATQEQLNEFEARNIVNAELWLRRRSVPLDLASLADLQLLHRKMFGETWRWAGRFRTKATNVGVDWPYITENLHALCGDVRYWLGSPPWPWPELAVRFHHRLVTIHPFVNGNGRHARLAANLLLEQNGLPRLPFGGRSLVAEGDSRTRYLAALREADRGDYAPLVDFASRVTG